MIGRDGNKQDARRLTEEIEAATNGVLAGSRDGSVLENGVSEPARRDPELERMASELGQASLELGRGGQRDILERSRAERASGLEHGELNLGVVSELGQGGQGLGREAISSIGGGVLEAVADRERTVEAAELVKTMAEQDNGYGKEYIPGVMTAENESPYEIEQRKKLEAENRWNEDHPKGNRDAKIVAHDQGEDGVAAYNMSKSYYTKGDFDIMDFYGNFRSLQDRTLLNFEEPHPIGKGNG